MNMNMNRRRQLPPAEFSALEVLCKDQNRFREALDMACLLDRRGLGIPRGIIYNLLQHCSRKKDLNAATARQVHVLMINNNLDSVSVLADHLIRLFSASGNLAEASRAFHNVLKPTVFTWNSILSAHTKLGSYHQALVLYSSMVQQGVQEDKVTFLVITKACAYPGNANCGRQIHDRIIRTGFDSDVMVRNSLVDMYAKFHSIDEARQVFDLFPDRTIVSWSSMIKGHVDHGQGYKAVELFEKMQAKSILPDILLMSCILQSCGMVRDVKLGKLVHHVLVEQNGQSGVIVGSTLLDMYVKCGCLEDACKVFGCIPNKDVVLWGTMIAGFAFYGDVDRTLACFQDMQKGGLEPDEMIMTNVLNVCSQGGLFEEGNKYFDSLENYCDRYIEHYNGMVDILSRIGSLKEAFYLLQTMPISPDVIGWRSLLAGCRLHEDVILARHCFDEAFKLDSSDSSTYALMKDTYAKAGMWEDVAKLKELEKKISSSI